MPDEYNPEQFWRLFEKLPQELREVMSAEETGNDIADVCKRNEVDELLIRKVAKYAGYVLLGVLPPEDFQKTLQKEVGLKNGTAKQVAQEIYRHIFFPVRSLLEELYKVDIAARLAKPSPEPAAVKEAAAAPAEAPAKAKPKKADVYREPVE